MSHEKVAPHEAGPDRKTTSISNNNRSDQNSRLVLWQPADQSFALAQRMGIARRLTGSRCRCQTCGEAFNSVSVFDRHPVGSWRERGIHRRCLSVSEMTTRGWSLNARGFWIERRRAPADFDRMRRSGDRLEPAVGGHPPEGKETARAVA